MCLGNSIFQLLWLAPLADTYIKTHGSVSCGPRSRRATREYINRKKETQFSHLCSSVIPYPIGTKFATEVPAS